MRKVDDGGCLSRGRRSRTRTSTSWRSVLAQVSTFRHLPWHELERFSASERSFETSSAHRGYEGL